MRYGGRLEAFFIVPDETSVNVTTVGGGPTTVSLTADSYTPTQLCAHLQARLIAVVGGAWTVTLSVGRSGTGRVTIAYGSAFTIGWTSTRLRDVLGFDDDISIVATATGPGQARGLWFPDCPLFIANGHPLRAPRVTDLRGARSPGGRSIGYAGSSYRAHRDLKYSHIPIGRMFEGDAATPKASFIAWLEDTQWGEGHPFFVPLSPFVLITELGGVEVALGGDLNDGAGPAGGWYFDPPIADESAVQNAASPTLGYWQLTIAGISSEG